MSEIDRVYQAQRQNQAAIAATTPAQRIDKLRRFERALLTRRPEIRAAMWEDFRKPPEEVDLTEVFAVVSEARHARRNLKKWMRPERAAPTITLIGSRSRLMYEAKGVAERASAKVKAGVSRIKSKLQGGRAKANARVNRAR